KLRPLFICLPVLLFEAGLGNLAQAALVGSSGYTNAFGSQPSAADWSTLSIAGAVADFPTPGAVDTAVQGVSSSTITTQLSPDGTIDPPAFLANATWSSLGFYAQTRPTGNGVTLLMCTLVNNLGANGAGAIISYDFAK